MSEMDPSWIGEDDLYRENILDHFRHPHNFGSLQACTFSHREFNPVCGDDIQLFVALEHGKVGDARFVGKGCAISMASASMLTDKIRGLSVEQLKQLQRDDVLEMLGIELGVVRMKCGLLSLKALLKGIDGAGI